MLIKIIFRGILKLKENKELTIISFLLGLNSLFFIALVVEQVGFFAFFSVKKIYLIYFILFLAYLFLWKKLFKKNFLSQNFLETSFWVFGPMVAILLYGFSESIKFNYTFKIGAGFYFIVLGLFLIFKYKKYSNISQFWKIKNKKFKEASLKKKITIGALLILVFLLNVGFGSYHLSRFAAVDEALWTHGRITKYWNNIVEREWEKTRVSDKPGITVALLTGPGLLFVEPNDYERHDNYGRDFNPPKDIKDMNLAFRLPIFLFTTLGIFIFYFFLRNLIGRKKAVLAAILIGLSPLLLGISTIINPDSLLWIFAPLTFLAFFNYLKNQEDHWLYMTGIMLGFSILTKYVANIFYVFFLGLIFLEYIFNAPKYKATKTGEYLKKAFIDYFIVIFFSLTVFYLLLPKAWIQIEALYNGTILSQAFQKVWPAFLFLLVYLSLDMFVFGSKSITWIIRKLTKYRKWIITSVGIMFLFFIFFTYFNTILNMEWFDLESILASPKSAYLEHGILGMMTANFYSLIFGILPLALVGVIIFTFQLIKGKKKRHNEFLGFSIIIFILLYYLASSVNNVSSTVRYQIILYPLVFVLGAMGLGTIIEKFKDKRNFIFVSSAFILIIFSLYSLNFIRPFYFSYANDLLPKKYVLNLKDMGDGSYEAAEFLNSLPEPEKIEIWTDKRGVCMFFVGICRSGIGIEKGEYDIDYFVLSSGRESRTSTMTLNRYEGGNKKLIRIDKLYDEKNPFWKLEIGERSNNFVKIIKVN